MGFEEIAPALVATAAKIARLQDLTFEADVLESASASLIQTGSSEDFGQTFDYYTLMLEVPIPLYVAVDDLRTGLEKRIHNRIDQLVRTERTNRITEVVISPILARHDQPSTATHSAGRAGRGTAFILAVGIFSSLC